MSNLLRRLFQRNRVFLLACGVLVGIFQFILCAIVASVDIGGVLEQIMVFAPPIMRAMIDQAMMGGTPEGLLAFAWNHPVTHTVTTAIALTLGARAVAGEVENGGIELLLAQPISRATFISAQLLFGFGAILLVGALGVTGSLVGQNYFSLDAFGIGEMLRLLLNLLLLQGAFFCITLLISCFGREAGRVALMGVLIAVVSYLINVIGTLWGKASFALPFSLHTYYDPRKLLVDGVQPMGAVAVLGTVILLATALAFWRFETRDLP